MLPTGTVTFLFSDIQGSTQLLQKLSADYSRVLHEHQHLLRAAFAKYDGVVVDTQGDSFFVVFPGALDAVHAAAHAQRALFVHEWGNGIRVNVRMGLHTGEPTLVGERYVGIDVHRAARIGSAAHGGQVLISETTHVLIKNDLPHDVTLRDLGEHRLKDLRTPKHLYQLVIAELPAEFPPLKTLDTTPNNLPVQLTSFVGREKEIRELKQLVSKARLITLTGSGGSGKTRLSVQIGGEVLEQFRGGIWFIELAPLAEPELVPQAIASILGVREQSGEPIRDALTSYLRDKHLLLILDNCEHLIDACAKLANHLLRACPHLKILASSREALGIAGEVPYRVPSLTLPPLSNLQSPSDALYRTNLEQYEAVRLFIDRAVMLQPNFSVINQNAPAVAQICVRLDGIPLALELAAARIQVLSAEQIARKLDDRFRLLTGGSRTALPRQQTLRAAIDWSYDLLSEQERVLLQRLSVFAGGWTLEAAEFVCADELIQDIELLDLLTYLVDKSLASFQEELGQARYRMLETVRQYAREKLLEADDAARIRDQHLGYFCALAEQAEPKLKSGEQLIWLERLETEHDNLRAALTWALDVGGIERGLSLAAALWTFWVVYGYMREGRGFLEKLLAKPRPIETTEIRAKGLLVIGSLAGYLGDDIAGQSYLAESEALWQEFGPSGKQGLAMTRLCLIMALGYQRQEQVMARRRFEENRKLFQEAGDQWGVAESLFHIGAMARGERDLDGMRQAYESSLTLFRGLGDELRASTVLRGLGKTAFLQGNYSKARALLEKTLEFQRATSFKIAIGATLYWLGLTAIRQGEYERAKMFFSEQLALEREMGLPLNSPDDLLKLAAIALGDRNLKRAVQLFAAAEALGQAMGEFDEYDAVEYAHFATVLREQWSEPAFTQAWQEGRALTMEQALVLAQQE